MRNYDRIKSMSVEEMARLNLYFIPDNKYGYHYTGLSGAYRNTAEETIQDNIQWLLQEVSEDEENNR